MKIVLFFYVQKIEKIAKKREKYTNHFVGYRKNNYFEKNKGKYAKRDKSKLKQKEKLPDWASEESTLA